MVLKAAVISYKFIVPENMPKSSYTYQKLFRALYGYKQDVYKPMKKAYVYHRPGVLSYYPYIKPNKNKVIVPMEAVQDLRAFFQTGVNPTHNWREKGQWKILYQMEEIDLEPSKAVSALESLLDRTIINNSLLEKAIYDKSIPKSEILPLAEKIVSSSWFKEAYKFSNRLSSFYSAYRSLL